MNHPFVDGNKRMGLAAMDLFLVLNGHFLDTTEDDAVSTILSVAKGEMTRTELAEWINVHISAL